MTVRLITPPAAEPVTLEMARLHTRAEAVEDDALLTVLITAARQHRSFRFRGIILWPDR